MVSTLPSTSVNLQRAISPSTQWGGHPVFDIVIPSSTANTAVSRDSVRQREAPGRPGSRRHRRWLNDQYLRPLPGDEDKEDKTLFDAHRTVPAPWMWGGAYDDDECTEEWDGFCEMSEEAQNELLAKTNPDTRKGRRTRKLDKSTRDLLRRHGDKQFSQEVILRLRVFAKGVGKSVRLDLPDEAAAEKSLQRRLVHALCRSLDLRSETVWVPSADGLSKMPHIVATR